MKKVFLVVTMLVSIALNGSASDSLKIVTLQREVNNLKVSFFRLHQENGRIRGLYQQQKIKIDSLLLGQEQQAEDIKVLAEKVGVALSETNKNIQNSKESLTSSINIRTWLAVCGILLSIALLIVSYFILKKRMHVVKSKIAEDSVEMDNRLSGLLNQIVGVQTNILNLNSSISTLQISSSNQQDHTLALKVADEIVRIETNLSRMDESIKGYKQLKKAVERIRTNFLANGYEIVEMLGKPYNEGMKVVANFVSDETLGEGEQKITGIIKPQINYKGKMIQSAQITVSQNL